METAEKSKQGAKKPPKKISKTYLENAALYYLQRYATSAANLRKVLMRKVTRSCAFHGQPPEDFAPLVDELVARYTAVGLLDDGGFALARVTSLRRQGLSERAIVAKLQQKGLSAGQIGAALKAVDAEQEEPELAAARAYAKRKKLGPWRRKVFADARAGAQKELAAMGRAGFGFDVARKALGSGFDEED